MGKQNRKAVYEANVLRVFWVDIVLSCLSLDAFDFLAEIDRKFNINKIKILRGRKHAPKYTEVNKKGGKVSYETVRGY